MTTATPSESSPRGTPINQLFAAWQIADAPEKEDLGEKLRRALFQFAGRMIYLIMRHENVHLQNEMVNDLWMGLDTFQGKSAFSSWAYAWFRNRCVTEWKYINKSLGKSLDSLADYKDYEEPNSGNALSRDVQSALSQIPKNESEIYSNEYREGLSELDNRILDLRMDGLTVREIAKEIGTLGKSAVSRHLAALPKVEV